MKNLLLLLLAVVVCVGCQLSSKAAPRGGSTLHLDPKHVPTELTLSPVDSVLLVTLEARSTGYRITSARIIHGTLNRVQLGGDDVVITGLDQNGRPVGSTAVFNPRVIHTTGARKPASVIVPKAVFSVMLPKPTEIRSIIIDVKRGPNAKLRQTLQLERAG